MILGFFCLGIGVLLLLATIIDGLASLRLMKARMRILIGIFGLLLLCYGGYSVGVIERSWRIDTSLNGSIQSNDPTQLVVVTFPEDGDSVKCRILTEGICPESYDKDIWVLLRPADGKYYPQSDHVSTTYMRNGEWQVITRFGGRKGEIFELNVYEADAAASAFFSTTIESWKEALSYPGLTDSEIPEGANLVERISVPLLNDCRGVF